MSHDHNGMPVKERDEVLVIRSVGHVKKGDVGTIMSTGNKDAIVDFSKQYDSGYSDIYLTSDCFELMPVVVTEEEVQTAIQSIQRSLHG